MKFLKTDKLLTVWIILVLTGIAWPGQELPDINPIYSFDKIVHMILFGVVTFLANRAITARGARQRTADIISLITGAVYAGLAEIIQVFVPGRSCSIFDFYAGVSGAIIAIAVIHL